jgi:hypothetical protein
MIQGTSKPPLREDGIFNTANKQAALAGAAGGFLGFIAGEWVQASGTGDALGLIWGAALWAALIGTCVGSAILAFDNWRGLRGRWNRDIGKALPLFYALSFLGGAAGQTFYLLAQNSITRGIGWALMGVGLGAGIGLLRRDKLQAQRGALGGAVGGFIGGFLFNAFTLISSAGDGSFSRAVGLMITGACIALLMRVVQDALKNAWLLGVSTGPYEGREYPLNTARVSVGRSEAADIALFRENDLPASLGAFVFQNGEWHWQGVPVDINGELQTQAQLQPGDTIRFGTTNFRFRTRSTKAPAPAVFSGGIPAAPVQRASPVPIAAAPKPPVWESPVQAVLSPAAWRLVRSDGSEVRLPAPPSRPELGRSPELQIVLSDDSVSSHHARFDVEAQRLAVYDLYSTNGTLVNGAPVIPQVAVDLRPGDTVTFGRETFTVQR